MFIKTSTRKKASGQSYKTHYLVEAYRDKNSGKSKHKYISNLSALPDNIILTLQTSLKQKKCEIEKLNLSELEILCNKQYGNIAIFSKLYDLYFGKYFTNKKYNKALEAIIINKIFDTKSKNSLNNWISKTDLKSIKNKNDLYESLDYLQSEQSKIEKRLSKQNQGRNNIMLYDITSTYFEGKGDPDLCKYGYSRDHRKDRVQVNIGVITNSDGTPISVEIIEGNISDKQTLTNQIDKIKDKFNIKELTFIFDRGMKSKVNLEYIKEAGYEYVTALSHLELKKKAEENKIIQMSLFDKKDISSFEIDEDDKNENNGNNGNNENNRNKNENSNNDSSNGNNKKTKETKFYSLCHNPYKADRDKINRNKLITKTIEDLEKIQNFKRQYSVQILQDKVSKIINKYKCEKYIIYQIEEIKERIINKNTQKKDIKIHGKLTFTRNTEKIENDEKYDGFYMIESTDKNITKENSVKQYKDLQLVERAFNSVKNHIEIRPVFHYKESRIKGHIFSCFISYFLLHKFKEKTKDLLQYHTLDELLTELTKIHKNYLKIKSFCFTKITKLSDLGESLLKRFNISMSCIE